MIILLTASPRGGPSYCRIPLAEWLTPRDCCRPLWLKIALSLTSFCFSWLHTASPTLIRWHPWTLHRILCSTTPCCRRCWESYSWCISSCPWEVCCIDAPTLFCGWGTFRSPPPYSARLKLHKPGTQEFDPIGMCNLTRSSQWDCRRNKSTML